MPHGRPAKKRRLTPPTSTSKTSETVKSSDLFHRAADWDLEQDYEVKRSKKNSKENGKESNRLPVKSVEGKLEQLVRPSVEDDGDADSFLGDGSEDDGDTPPTDDSDVNVEATPTIPLKLQVVQTQEEIVRLATMINEDPEEHASAFKKLAALGDGKVHPTIRKLVLVSQVAVYKDAVPGYRIRAYRDEELSGKVSKDVRRTRGYEQALVTSYQTFVKRLVGLCKRGVKDEGDGLKTTALNCVCELVVAIPHFNFRTELLGVLVAELRAKEAGPHFRKALETLERFFDGDEDGGASLEGVTLLTKMIKGRDYDVREEVLDCFFHLRLLGELSVKHSMTRADRPEDISKLHGKKIKKEKWEHRSKKERKIDKERRAVEKDMKEADAAVDYESREKLQSETLKVVFVTYFRILKERVPGLMGAVLEGLAKFAHLINQDFFGDILEALKDIIRQAQAEEMDEVEGEAQQGRDRTRECLLAIQTAFTLLSRQDTAKSASALHLDLSFFTSHVYRSLYAAGMDADIELGPKAMHLPDPHATQLSKRDNKVNVTTPILLLTRALTAILLTPSSPPTTQVVATFYKRLLTISLQTPEKSTKALVTLMGSILDRHAKRLEPLWYSDERKGDGLFMGEAETVESTNVFAVGSGVWEEELLRCHYCPDISGRMKEFDKLVNGLAK